MEALATTPEGSQREMQSRFDESAWSYQFLGPLFLFNFFQNRAFWLVQVRGHYRAKIMCD